MQILKPFWLVPVVLLMGTTAVSAQSAEYIGADFFDSLQNMVTGNVGFFLGLLLTVLGLITMVFKQFSAGVVMLIGGVLITLSPGLFNSLRNLMADVLDTVGATSTASGFQTRP